MAYKELMQNSFAAHQKFKEVWSLWKSGKLKDAKGIKPHSEPKSLSDARNLFSEQNDLLYASKIYPLEQKFNNNYKAALNEVIEFLSVDIMAFRCGYAKEVFLQRLKVVEFSETETEKLRNLIIYICETKSFRREFRRWCRLAVKVADKDFVIKLQKLSICDNHFAKVKSDWMLRMIKQNRIDLRKI